MQASTPGYTLEEFSGPGASGEIFLSVCIPTYNRAPKLDRTLADLEEILAASPYRDRVEILVSNNVSPDDTAEVLRRRAPRLAAYAPVRAYTQTVNIGGDPNFKFLYQAARGRYVWICSDDDALDKAEFDRLIGDLETNDPEVCISSFVNHNSLKDSVQLPGGADTLLVTRVEEAVPYIFDLGKITQYVFRKHTLEGEEEEAAHKAVTTTAFWFVALSTLLVTRHRARLLVRAGVIARSDREVMNVRFSPRVYGTMKRAVLLGLGDHPSREHFDSTLPDGPFDVDVTLVAFLFRHSVGWIEMDPYAARQDFDYTRRHLRRLASRSWRNMVKLPFILALFPVGERLRGHRGATGAGPGAVLED